MVKFCDRPDYLGCNRKVIKKECSVPNRVPTHKPIGTIDLQKINMVRANKNKKSEVERLNLFVFPGTFGISPGFISIIITIHESKINPCHPFSLRLCSIVSKNTRELVRP